MDKKNPKEFGRQSVDAHICRQLDNVIRIGGRSKECGREIAQALKRIERLLEGNQCLPSSLKTELANVAKLNETRRGQNFRILKSIDSIEPSIRARLVAERTRDNHQPIKKYQMDLICGILNDHGIKSGNVAEIGGSGNAFMPDALPGFDYKFLSLFAEPKLPHVIQADITNCDHIPDQSFDVILSFSVLEHVDRPWLAAKHITRLLKPGGITFHAMPFSYFYHEAPIDYWRCTPQCLAFLFSELEPLVQEFYGANRRRNNFGSRFNPVDGCGGPQFAPDAFGGWRENWHTFYAGRKSVG